MGSFKKIFSTVYGLRITTEICIVYCLVVIGYKSSQSKTHVSLEFSE